MSKRKLDIGGGSIIREGYERIDIDKTVNPDIHHDLNKIPWPIESALYDEIVSYHTIEHLLDINPFLREVTRIAKDRSNFHFEFPHYSVTFIEPGHRRAYGLHALEYHKQFVLTKRRMEWSPNRENKGIVYRLLNKLISFFANLAPYKCERLWCYWVGGFSNVILDGYIDKSKITKEWFVDDDVFNKYPMVETPKKG